MTQCCTMPIYTLPSRLYVAGHILKVVFCSLNASGVYLDFLLLLIFILFLPFCNLFLNIQDDWPCYPAAWRKIFLNVMIIYPEILQQSYLKSDVLKHVTVTAFHFDSMMEIRGERRAAYKLCSFLLLVFSHQEPWNWNVTCSSPCLMLYGDFSRLEISILGFHLVS